MAYGLRSETQFGKDLFWAWCKRVAQSAIKIFSAMMSQFVGMSWFALLLAGQRGRLPILAPLGSALAAILTVSRATLGLTAVGMATIFAVSAIRKWTSRKAKIALLSAVSLLVLIPFAISSLESRFGSDYQPSGYDERAAFQKAAEMIVADHPMGVGANNYVVVANVGGYNRKAGVAARGESRATNVHNAYWLAAAETGYFGVLAFAILLLRPLIVAFQCGWRSREDQRGDLMLGLGITLLFVYVHCYFEWIIFRFQSQYLLAMTIGLVAGLAQQLGYWGQARANTPQLAPGVVRSNR